jgi:hypothetical protein
MIIDVVQHQIVHLNIQLGKQRMQVRISTTFHCIKSATPLAKSQRIRVTFSSTSFPDLGLAELRFAKCTTPRFCLNVSLLISSPLKQGPNFHCHELPSFPVPLEAGCLIAAVSNVLLWLAMALVNRMAGGIVESFSDSSENLVNNSALLPLQNTCALSARLRNSAVSYFCGSL